MMPKPSMITNVISMTTRTARSPRIVRTVTFGGGAASSSSVTAGGAPLASAGALPGLPSVGTELQRIAVHEVHAHPVEQWFLVVEPCYGSLDVVAVHGGQCTDRPRQPGEMPRGGLPACPPLGLCSARAPSRALPYPPMAGGSSSNSGQTSFGIGKTGRRHELQLMGEGLVFAPVLMTPTGSPPRGGQELGRLQVVRDAALA